MILTPDTYDEQQKFIDLFSDCVDEVVVNQYSERGQSINQLSEQSYMKYSNIPMIPSLQNSITDPSHIVEGVASEGWVRG